MKGVGGVIHSAPRRLSALSCTILPVTPSLSEVMSYGFLYYCYADHTKVMLSFPPSDTHTSAWKTSSHG